MSKSMVELLTEETNRLEGKGMVYFSKPYSCCYEEAMNYFRGFEAPNPETYTIERTDKQTTISIKPLKGSRKRKLFVIKLWVS